MKTLSTITAAVLALAAFLAPALACASNGVQLPTETQILADAAESFPDDSANGWTVVETGDCASEVSDQPDVTCATIEHDTAGTFGLMYRGSHLLAGFEVSQGGVWSELFTAN